MPRPVDRDKYDSKRSAIVRVAAGQFAEHGYRGATTAAICQAAGISSGTFFHYFPTKLELLVAVLSSDVDDLSADLERIEAEASGLAAILAYAAALEGDIADSSYSTFVNGLLGVAAEPSVAAMLSAESETVLAFLVRHVDIGQRDTSIRRDVSAPNLAAWIGWLIDGAAQSAVAGLSERPIPLREAILALTTSGTKEMTR